MIFVKNVHHYAALLYASEGHTRARMNLYCDDNHKLYILFYDDNEELPKNIYKPDVKVGIAYLPYSSYPHYIDLIRNEKPIKLTFDVQTDPPRFVMYASQEEPGEGEMFWKQVEG